MKEFSWLVVMTALSAYTTMSRYQFGGFVITPGDLAWKKLTFHILDTDTIHFLQSDCQTMFESTYA